MGCRRPELGLGVFDIGASFVNSLSQAAHMGPMIAPTTSVPYQQPCGAQNCLRSSDIGVPTAGDPVAIVHPNCSVHGDPHGFVPGGGFDGAGREFCERCRAYADEHPKTGENP